MSPHGHSFLIGDFGHNIGALTLSPQNQAVGQPIIEQGEANEDKHEVTTVRWSNDGNYVAIGFQGGRRKRGFIVWEAKDPMKWRPVKTMFGFGDGLRDLCWGPNNRYIAAIFYHNREMRIFNTSDWKVAKTIQCFADSDKVGNTQGGRHGCGSLDWNPITGIIAVGCGDGIVELWDPEDSTMLGRFKREANQTKYTNLTRIVRFGPLGQRIGSIETEFGNEIQIWDFNSGNLIRTIIAHKDPAKKKLIPTPINKLKWHPSGKYLVTASFNDNAAEIYDVETGGRVERIRIKKPKDIGIDRLSGDMLFVGATLNTKEYQL
ncbi:MAG: hypothetical protein AAF998_06820 [Bacteroidota bacterium]